ncbi:MAG: serine hydrolase domain-containing protein [Acutalibacteraceae bacterium]|nr:serine hydrolase domain-containing protein [Acutalibacteraceae bacterium]
MNFTKLTEFLDDLPSRYSIPGGDLIVNKDGKTVYRHCFGYSDKDKTRKVQGNEIYRIYSCSKVITCTAIMKLVCEGKLGLYDNLSDYISEFKEMKVKKGDGLVTANNPIRIVDLMQMAAGFTYDCDFPALREYRSKTDGKGDTLGMVRTMAKMPLEFEPGEAFRYSLCHDILGGVIEVVSGQKLSDFMKENFFIPLGMLETDYKYTFGSPDRYFWRSCYNAETNSTTYVASDTNWFEMGTEYESGGAGIITTVDDYIKFSQMLCDGGVTKDGKRLIDFEGIDLMRKTINEKQSAFTMTDYKYALGVRSHVSHENGFSKSALYEFGWDGAHGAYTEIDIENGIAVYFGCGTSDINALVHPEMRNLIHEAVEAE